MIPHGKRIARSSHEQLLAELERTLTPASDEERHRRVRTLESLLRIPLVNPGGTVEVLSEMLKAIGSAEPESTLVLKYLRRATRSDGDALVTLIRLVGERQEGAIRSSCRLLPALGPKTQSGLGQALAKELFQRNGIDQLTEDIVAALQQLQHRDPAHVVTREVSGHLGSPNGLRIRHATAILSQFGHTSVARALVSVLRKVLDGYYDGHAEPITKNLCRYFQKCPTKSAVAELLRGVEIQRHHCLAETLGVMCDALPEVQGAILRFAKNAGEPVQVLCLDGLSIMRKARPRLTEIAKIVLANNLLKYTAAKASFGKILHNNAMEAEEILFEMLKSDREECYEFALDVLKDLRIPISEIARALGVHPVRAIHGYFWGQREKLTFDDLWKAKERLGGSVSGKTTRFEHLVRDALSCLGFITLDVDKSGKPGVDIVAFPPVGCTALIVGTTTGVPDDDLEKLANTTATLVAWLGSLARRIRIVPIVITSLPAETNPKSADYAKRHGIIILRASDVDRLIGWANTHRNYAALLAYLDEKSDSSRLPLFGR